MVENVRRRTSEKALVSNNASHVAVGGVKTTGESQGESDVGMLGYILPRSGWPQSKKSRDRPAQQLLLQVPLRIVCQNVVEMGSGSRRPPKYREHYRSSRVDQIWAGRRLAVGLIIKGWSG